LLSYKFLCQEFFPQVPFFPFVTFEQGLPPFVIHTLSLGPVETSPCPHHILFHQSFLVVFFFFHNFYPSALPFLSVPLYSIPECRIFTFPLFFSILLCHHSLFCPPYASLTLQFTFFRCHPPTRLFSSIWGPFHPPLFPCRWVVLWCSICACTPKLPFKNDFSPFSLSPPPSFLEVPNRCFWPPHIFPPPCPCPQ